MEIDNRRVILHLTIRAAHGRRSELIEFLRSAIPFYEQPRGIKIRLLQSTEDPDSFVEIVEYESWDKYHEDARRVEDDKEMQSYLDKWRSLLFAQAKTEVYTELIDGTGNSEKLRPDG